MNTQNLVSGFCFLTGLSLAIGLLVTLTQLQVPFYLYYPHVTQTILVSGPVDLYLFLLSSGCVPAALFVNARKLSRSGMIGILVIWMVGLAMIILQQPYGALILYVTVLYAAVLEVLKSDHQRSVVSQLLIPVLAIFLLIEFSVLYYWAASALTPGQRFGLSAEQLELSLTFSPFPIEMLMMLVLLFSWLWVPLVKPSNGRIRLLVRYQPSPGFKWDKRVMLAALDLFAIVAVLMFYYPYLAGQTWIVGVDSVWRYLDPLKDLAGLAPSEAFASSFRHGVYLVGLYLIELATGGSAFIVVKFAPLVLAFMLASVVFLTLLRAGWTQELAILGSMCTLFWFPTTLGMYAGIQANWLAFILWMLFLSFYFLEGSWNRLVIVAEALISLAILLVHPWTWGVFFVSVLLTAIISSWGAWRERSFQGVVAALTLALPVGFAAYLFLPGMKYDLRDTIQLYAFPLIHPESLLSFGPALGELFYDWSPFLSPILLLLCVLGAYALSGRGASLSRNYLIAWIGTWCIGSILVAPAGFNPGISETGIWRMLYVSPLPFLLALGVWKCLDLSNRIVIRENFHRLELPIMLCSFALFSGGLVVSENVLAKLAVVMVTLGFVVFLALRFRNYPVARTLIVSLLILIVANAAFRSLYPLLLDPHNLLGPPGSG